MALVTNNPTADAVDISDPDLIPGSGRFPGGGHDILLQYSCLENLMESVESHGQMSLAGYSPRVTRVGHS